MLYAIYWLLPLLTDDGPMDFIAIANTCVLAVGPFIDGWPIY
jgi:hypothetical protein